VPIHLRRLQREVREGALHRMANSNSILSVMPQLAVPACRRMTKSPSFLRDSFSIIAAAVTRQSVLAGTPRDQDAVDEVVNNRPPMMIIRRAAAVVSDWRG